MLQTSEALSEFSEILRTQPDFEPAVRGLQRSRADSEQRGKCSGLELFAGFGIDDDGHRAVIDEAYKHMGAEASGLNRLTKIRGESGDEAFVERHRNFGTRGTAEGWTVAFFCAREQRELADDQDFAVDILN